MRGAELKSLQDACKMAVILHWGAKDGVLYDVLCSNFSDPF